MSCAFRNVSTARLHHRRKQRGYMLLTLMLAMALITMAMLAVLPEIGQQIKRDREEEMVHRGTAYMRAIQHFYRKFGRYPSSLEELENTDNIRFLRKRYKDPMSRDPVTGTENDFKLIHQADIARNNGPALPGQNGFVGQSGLPAQGGLGGATPGGLGDVGAETGGAGGQASANGNPGNSDASGNSNSPESPSSNSETGSNSGLGFDAPTFGGEAILGVASTSKAKTIRVFFGKTHYNDWLFIYLVQVNNRGRLVMGPVDPNQSATTNLNGFGLTPGQPGAGASGQGLGQGQGLMPNAGQTQVVPQPQQNPGRTPTQP